MQRSRAASRGGSADGLTRLAAITREVAIIETHAILIPGREDRALCEFFDDSALNDDASNWWVPNEKALVERNLSQRLRNKKYRKPRDPIYYRAIVHAWK